MVARDLRRLAIGTELRPRTIEIPLCIRDSLFVNARTRALDVKSTAETLSGVRSGSFNGPTSDSICVGALRRSYDVLIFGRPRGRARVVERGATLLGSICEKDESPRAAVVGGERQDCIPGTTSRLAVVRSEPNRQSDVSVRGESGRFQAECIRACTPAKAPRPLRARARQTKEYEGSLLSGAILGRRRFWDCRPRLGRCWDPAYARCGALANCLGATTHRHAGGYRSVWGVGLFFASRPVRPFFLSRTPQPHRHPDLFQHGEPLHRTPARP